MTITITVIVDDPLHRWMVIVKNSTPIISRYSWFNYLRWLEIFLPFLFLLLLVTVIWSSILIRKIATDNWRFLVIHLQQRATTGGMSGVWAVLERREMLRWIVFDIPRTRMRTRCVFREIRVFQLMLRGTDAITAR